MVYRIPPFAGFSHQGRFLNVFKSVSDAMPDITACIDTATLADTVL
jgi:hypothetical protein